MNKRGLIKYIFIIISAFMSFYFLTTSNIGFGKVFDFSMIFSFIVALTIFMFCNKEKIKKNKFIYDVTLMLLMIFTISCFILFLYDETICYLNSDCSIIIDSIFPIIYSIILFNMILFGFKGIFNKTNKVNDILTIVVSSLIILIHIRYYLDPNFIHRLIKSGEYAIYSYSYITQNYLYFIIMYVVVMIHQRINKVL